MDFGQLLEQRFIVNRGKTVSQSRFETLYRFKNNTSYNTTFTDEYHFEFICYYQEISHNNKAETETHFLNYMAIPIPLKFTITQVFSSKKVTKIQPAKRPNIFS